MNADKNNWSAGFSPLHHASVIDDLITLFIRMVMRNHIQAFLIRVYPCPSVVEES
jgi:hypothetical protein